MFKRLLFLLPVLFLTHAGRSPLMGQEIEDLVSRYTSENGQGYLQPLADAFGSNLNSGLFHSARIPRFGLNIELSLETATALITDEQKTFTATTDGLFEPVQSAEVPTIFGDADPYEVQGTGGTVYTFPGGFAVDRLPIAVPQIAVGSFMGTQGVLRYINLDLGENFGTLKLLGYGFRHSLSQYLPLLPVDLAATFFRQKFELGDIVQASATYYGIMASKRSGMLELYAAYGFGSSDLDISYEYEGAEGPEQISFNLQSESASRLTLGLALTLSRLNVHADFSMGSSNVAGLGVGLTL